MSYNPDESGPWSDTDEYPGMVDVPICPFCGMEMVPLNFARSSYAWQVVPEFSCSQHPWVSGGPA